jgi:hypothetical protein
MKGRAREFLYVKPEFIIPCSSCPAGYPPAGFFILFPKRRVYEMVLFR